MAGLAGAGTRPKPARWGATGCLCCRASAGRLGPVWLNARNLCGSRGSAFSGRSPGGRGHIAQRA